MKVRNTGIKTLLGKNISKGQLLGYSIANLIGLTIILAGILFYCDSHHQNKTNDKFFSEDFIVISKKVTGVNLEPISFSREEINNLKEMPWVKEVGEFSSADFSVSASINLGNSGMSSFLFLESVPDEFFETTPSKWYFNPSEKFLPIVLNKDYLVLYNFGFAIPRGLPQLSEDMIGTIPLKLYIKGENGRAEMFDAEVVGFSSRLNTIAVPQDFMDWANNRFSNEPKKHETSRLILKIDRMKSAESDKFFKEMGYEVAGDKEADSKISVFMGIVSGVMTATGTVISLLALFILILSIFLLLQKSRPMLRNLILLGYSPLQPAHFYEKTVLIINLIITGLAIGLAFVCRLIWHHSLLALGLGNGNVLFTIGAALVYFIVVTGINFIVIRKHLFSIWRTN